MRQADCALSLIDVLAARAAGTKGVDLALAQQVFIRIRQTGHLRVLYGIELSTLTKRQFHLAERKVRILYRHLQIEKGMPEQNQQASPYVLLEAGTSRTQIMITRARDVARGARGGTVTSIGGIAGTTIRGV
jgi:hypothetical protein